MTIRIFLANPDIDTDIPEYIDEAFEDIEDGYPKEITWSTGQVKSVEIGDRAFFKKTGRGVRGFIAAGEVIKADVEDRLNTNPQYAKYSDAYTKHFFQKSPTVLIRIDSVVRLNRPLEDKYLLSLPQMKGVNLVRYGGGQELGSKYEKALEAEWKKYCLKLKSSGESALLKD